MSVFDSSGNFWSDVGDIATTLLAAQVLPGMGPLPMGITSQALVPSPQGSFVDPLTAPLTPTTIARCGIPKGYHISCVCGVMKYVKNRKRKRQLASKSDLANLAALIGIAGNGKLVQVWVATHG